MKIQVTINDNGSRVLDTVFDSEYTENTWELIRILLEGSGTGSLGRHIIGIEKKTIEDGVYWFYDDALRLVNVSIKE